VQPTSVDIYRQSGTLVYRFVSQQPQILLITTRKGQWTIPKGIVEPHLSPAESALHEAHEEAGVRGKLVEPSIGRFTYTKWGGVCTVEVFLLEATELQASWPEDDFRRRRWSAIRTAAEMVKYDQLADLIRRAERPIRLRHKLGEKR
jgi:8-oxo-dGTP pyrophosphatase MutT (NUDIX family)